MPWVLCAALYKDVSASMTSMEMNFIVLHGFLLYLLEKGPEIFKLVLDGVLIVSFLGQTAHSILIVHSA